MEMQFGICVRTSFYYDAKGRGRIKAYHKRDRMTTWKVVDTSPENSFNHQAALQAWIDKFTGSDEYFESTFKVVARGGDHEGYYFILVPVS